MKDIIKKQNKNYLTLEANMRLKLEERERFHNYLDLCLDKLESEKNKGKPHWRKFDKHLLCDLLKIEMQELEFSIKWSCTDDIEDELKDVINLAMFLYDNNFDV